MSEKQAKIAFLSIGSNLGDKKKNIEFVKFKLEKNKIKIVDFSNDYETLSWPNQKEPKFINIVIKIRTVFSPFELIKRWLEIENELGRIRKKKNDPRTCDIDIIDYDQKVIRDINKQKLTLPHPKMHIRNFVLLPFFEIAKAWIHPIKKIGIKELVNSLKTKDLRAIKLI